MSDAIHDRVIGRLVRCFDRPVMQNDLRGMYVEFLVVELLGVDWDPVGSAWAGWDIQHKDGTKVEVKQSAARQIWQPSSNGRSAPQFGIRAPKGHWVDGSNWAKSEGRLADIYIFAWHSSLENDADQRSLEQWKFYVIDALDLPANQKTIGLGSLSKIVESVEYSELHAKTDDIRLARTKEETAA